MTVQGFRVTIANALVCDHRVRAFQATPDRPRYWRLGDIVTLDDIDDFDRYPDGRPNVWAWVHGGVVDPVGWPTFRVVERIPATDHSGFNPGGYVKHGQTVTRWHFPEHVNISALVDGGQLQPETDPSNEPKE